MISMAFLSAFSVIFSKPAADVSSYRQNIKRKDFTFTRPVFQKRDRLEGMNRAAQKRNTVIITIKDRVIMIEQDTIKLLRECDAGVKMGASSLHDVLQYVHSEKLKQLLSDCRKEHDRLDGEIQSLLDRYRDEGKDPNPIGKKMAEMKTKMELTVHDSDETIADLMTDGCNMGVKSLSRYLNQYKAADEASKDIAKRLIALEAKLAADIRGFL